MTVFKTFWKVVKQYKGTIILYTVMLIIFGGMNMSTSENQMNFVASKPDILILNEDNQKLSKNLEHYLEENSNLISIENKEEKINDALFYRDVNYVIYIPKNYSENVKKGLSPQIEIKSTGDYQASLAQMMLQKYLQVQNIYQMKIKDEDKLIKKINETINKNASIEIVSKLDTKKTTNASTYFNFASYSIMAVVIFVVCLVLSSFKEKNINKRTIISSTNYKKYNRSLLFASFIYTCIVWLLFILLGMFILKDTLFSLRGLIYVLNAFLFTFCSLTIALLISNLINNKNAVSGIVNVIALGSAFLCGAFVPAEYLPSFVLKIAHLLPAYFYINSNDLLKTIETLNVVNLQPILLNGLMIILFSIAFIVINNQISKYKQKID